MHASMTSLGVIATSPSAWRPRSGDPYLLSNHSARRMRHLPSTICQARQGLLDQSPSPKIGAGPTHVEAPERHISQHSSAVLIVLNLKAMPQLFSVSPSHAWFGSSHDDDSGMRPSGSVGESPTTRWKPPLGTQRPPLLRLDASAEPAAWRQ